MSSALNTIPKINRYHNTNTYPNLHPNPNLNMNSDPNPNPNLNLPSRRLLMRPSSSRRTPMRHFHSSYRMRR